MAAALQARGSMCRLADWRTPWLQRQQQQRPELDGACKHTDRGGATDATLPRPLTPLVYRLYISTQYSVCGQPLLSIVQCPSPPRLQASVSLWRVCVCTDAMYSMQQRLVSMSPTSHVWPMVSPGAHTAGVLAVVGMPPSA
jgi:hypothetical protein